jgi:hypothetical protein
MLVKKGRHLGKLTILIGANRRELPRIMRDEDADIRIKVESQALSDAPIDCKLRIFMSPVSLFFGMGGPSDRKIPESHSRLNVPKLPGSAALLCQDAFGG